MVGAGSLRDSLRVRMIVLGVLAVVGALLVSGGSVSAQSGPSATCSGSLGTQFGTDLFGPGERGVALLSSSPQTREFALAAPVPAGTWTVDAVSYDGYPGRDTIDPQPFEQWYAELLAADGSVLATTAPTADLEDSVTEATWAGSLGDVTTAAEAVAVRVVHNAPGDPSPNSVRPSCIAFEQVVVAAPSTITVTFEDQGGTPGSIGVVCGDKSESATGATATIGLVDLAAGSSCDVTYPMDRSCTVALDPAGTANAIVGAALRISIPAEGGVDIVVDIVCPAPAPEPTPDPDDTTTPDTTTPDTDDSSTPADDDVTTEVAGQVETPAGAAVPQPGSPAFAG